MSCHLLQSTQGDTDHAFAGPAACVAQVIPFSFLCLPDDDPAGAASRFRTAAAPGHQVASPSSALAINEQELMQALAGGKAFRVVLQPQYDLRTGALVGAEALTRWNHQRLGEIAPAVFMPALTRMGIEPVLFEQVVAQIQALLRILVDAGAACPISVNTSVATLSIPGLLRQLDCSLNEHQVSPRLIKIEITEDLAIDDLHNLADELHWLRSRGFGISMDDFGTGTSTLERLTQLPFTELKIDRSFVRRMLGEPAAGAVVQAALDLGKALGVEVVAEGIECAEQVRVLCNFGVRVGQGYALGAPMEVEAFIACALAAAGSR